MTVRAVAKYCGSSWRTSYGSRDSDSVVNDTRSPNSTEVTRRSARMRGCAVGWWGMAPTVVGVPHSAQNRPETGAPQEAQSAACVAPQSGQNFAPDGGEPPHA